MTGHDASNSATTTWFLFSEDGKPLGQIYRSGRGVVPSVGDQLADGRGWTRAEVVDFNQLPTTCEMRRFRVVIRVIE